MRLPKGPLARALLNIEFRDGLDLKSVEENGWMLTGGAGGLHSLNLYLGRWNAPWFVLASSYRTLDGRTGYRTWTEGGADWAASEIVSGMALKHDWEMEMEKPGSGSFAAWFRSEGPRIFRVRRKSPEKVLQLAQVIPWSNRRIRSDRLVNGEMDVDLREEYYQEGLPDLDTLRSLDEKSLVVFAELFIRRPVALDKIDLSETCVSLPPWESARHGCNAWLYWGP